eukprot:scaffold147848_cov59-Attheya_sp.AAC.2
MAEREQEADDAENLNSLTFSRKKTSDPKQEEQQDDILSLFSLGHGGTGALLTVSVMFGGSSCTVHAYDIG